MKDGARLVLLVDGGAMHVTCTRSHKGWTVCGKLVPTGRTFITGNAATLERAFARVPRPCRNCARMRDAVTV